MLTLMKIKDLPEATIELSEAILVLFIQKHPLDISTVMKLLVQLVKQVELYVATFGLRSTAIPVVQAHDELHVGRGIRSHSCS